MNAKPRSKPRYAEVGDQLREAIERGDYPVGSLLPTELELCDRFEISRYTARAALTVFTVRKSPPNQPKMPTEITSGTMNCTAETPRLPSPAFRPSAEPLRSFGKKKLMLAMLELKLPPPKPHSAASTSNTQNGVFTFCSAKPMPIAGISSDSVDSTVQRRPPTMGTMNE